MGFRLRLLVLIHRGLAEGLPMKIKATMGTNSTRRLPFRTVSLGPNIIFLPERYLLMVSPNPMGLTMGITLLTKTTSRVLMGFSLV